MRARFSITPSRARRTKPNRCSRPNWPPRKNGLDAKPNDTLAALSVIPLLAARLDVATDDKQLEAAQADYLKYPEQTAAEAS